MVDNSPESVYDCRDCSGVVSLSHEFLMCTFESACVSDKTSYYMPDVGEGASTLVETSEYVKCGRCNPATS